MGFLCQITLFFFPLWVSPAELAVKVDGKSGEQKPGTPTTPRSKHSATEQRRRCKINDRFWKIDQVSSNRAPRGGIADPPNLTKNGPQSGLLFAGKFVDSSIPRAPTSLSNAHNLAEADMSLVPMQSNYYAAVGSGSGFMQPQERLISDSDNLASQTQSEWQSSSCMADCTVSNDMLNELEELTIDEGTIRISSVYTQGLLTAVSQAVASAGVDMSQASISVQINLARRASRRTTTTNMSSAKDHFYHSPINQVIGDLGGPENNVEGSEQAPKRQRVDTS
ncbi:hypothetical protein BHM03_00009871 [Ensete ventricosum]|nr:hypothetical protein BHM03_00009871 [Ensete ventricosum]